MSAKSSERAAFLALRICGYAVAAPILLILGLLIVKGAPALSAEFLLSAPRMGLKEGGIFPAIVGTVLLVALAISVALPLGIACAVYLNEYAGDSRLTRLIRLSIVNLAGVPSVVFGLFGLGLLVLFLKFGVSILSGSLTLAFLILPVVITASEEALTSVPKSFREASLALGATKMQTILRVVLPNALPGMLTGAILGVSRAAGETAPILFTVAAFYLPRLPSSIFDQAMALPYHLYIVSTQVPGASETVKYGTALVLVSLAFGLNLVAIIARNRIRKQRKW
ncbi:MAG TPA: phosphate ABC transporter permease PstA [bacterium]|nr:phosphate ABC transporter permease PstA [bacterium]